MAVFGGLFLIVGLAAGYFTAITTIKTAGTKNWTQVEATINSAKLESFQSDDGSTYRATGEYTYSWKGQSYISDVLFFGSGSDSWREYHSDIVDELKSHIASGQTMTARINPKDPSQSIIYNTIRWGLLGMMAVFTAVFGGIGGGMIWLSRHVSRTEKDEEQRRARYPDQPWKWKKAWQNSTLKNDSKTGFMAMAAFSTIWSVMSLPILFIVPGEVIKNRNYLALVGLLFPLIGLCLCIFTVMLYRQWKRFKDNTLTLSTYPAGLGHSLQGHLSVPNTLPQDMAFGVTLTSIRQYFTGSGDDRKSHEDILWQDEQTIPFKAARFGERYRLPVHFDLPPGGQPSYWEDSHETFIWRLNFKSEIVGADLDQNFEVPVFDPESYKFDLPSSTGKVSDSPAYVDLGDWRKTGVVYSELADGHYYYFPPARHKGTAFVVTMMTLFFGSVAFAPFFVDDMPLIFPILFVLFGVLMGLFAINLWFHKSAVETYPEGFSVRRGLFKGKYSDLTRNDVETLVLSSSMTSGTTKYYDIVAKLNDGEKITIASHMLGKRNVESLIEKLKSDFGMIDA